jgi:leucyl-tRNA synthetase
MKSYDHAKIEKKWQKEWADAGIYAAKDDGGGEKKYILDMFPYPSGEGLHVGHPKGYIATDIYSRYMRMNGKSVLHPMGWDAFGLPAENFAIKNKVHPRVAVDKNVARYKEQLQMIGLDYDWNREINTTDPSYYTWTQWIFLKLLEKGLAYESNEPINWCPTCMTGLSNEDLDGNECERCGTVVEKRPMRQWVLKILDYADRLLEDLELLPEWQAHIKESQRNWIGKSEGAEIDFYLDFGDEAVNARTNPDGKRVHLTVFTTRPDTLFGATYLVLAPEHPWLQLIMMEIRSPSHDGDTISIINIDEVAAYVEAAAKKTELERMADQKDKTGVELKGVQAINPATGEKIPLYVADYVLGHYGTGAIMAVPAHDERDYDFAKKFDLLVRRVIEPKFVATGETAMHDGEEIVRREAVAAIIHNPKDDTYLCNVWKGIEMRGLLTGGVEDNEDAVEAALREIREESGYKNVRFVEDTGWVINTFFFHRQKKQNRWARFRYLKFELENDERDPVDETERAKHEFVWKNRKELDKFFTVFEGDFVLKLLDNPEYVYTGEGILGNSGEFSGMDSAEAERAMTEKYGRKKTTYKLRDWVFSRQRYWGEPIPVVHCAECGTVPVPIAELPVRLPEVEHYEPTGTGESPLAAIEEWVNTSCPLCKGPAKRETNTMPQWAGSSWYYLRYMDPHNDSALVDPAKEKHWAPVDLYVGGAEHATRHLIYARFWHKFLYDIGVVSTPEPFTRLISVGLIMAEDGKKMSKRYGNVINPDDVITTYGADTLRVYEMFMGPFTDSIAWNTNSMIGSRRFLERVWKLQDKAVAEEGGADIESLLHRTIRKVGDDIKAFKFNTAISTMMIFVNAAEKGAVSASQYARFLQLLAPFAPHMTEEIWRTKGHNISIHVSEWPAYSEDIAREERVTIAVQINGKTRGSVELARDTDKAAIEHAAKEAVHEKLEGMQVVRVVVVPGRLVNFVSEK